MGVSYVEPNRGTVDVSAATSLPVAISTDVLATGGIGANPAFAVIDVAVCGETIVVSAIAGKRIRVVTGWIVVPGTVSVRFQDGDASTDLTGNMQLINGISLPYCPQGLFQTSVSGDLVMRLSAAVSAAGALTYVAVA